MYNTLWSKLHQKKNPKIKHVINVKMYKDILLTHFSFDSDVLKV